jgi:hypothetical protein
VSCCPVLSVCLAFCLSNAPLQNYIKGRPAKKTKTKKSFPRQKEKENQQSKQRHILYHIYPHLHMHGSTVRSSPVQSSPLLTTHYSLQYSTVRTSSNSNSRTHILACIHHIYLSLPCIVFSSRRHCLYNTLYLYFLFSPTPTPTDGTVQYSTRKSKSKCEKRRNKEGNTGR